MTAELVCAATDPAWPQVRTQMSARRGHPVRYGYVISEADGHSWVSPYYWSTAEAAQRAGETDAGSHNLSRNLPHRDEPDCDCGRCEPAVMDGPPTLGQMLSGNSGCEWPACAIGEGCRWGNSTCIADAEARRDR